VSDVRHASRLSAYRAPNTLTLTLSVAETREPRPGLLGGREFPDKP
jgi:hypothetical protein